MCSGLYVVEYSEEGRRNRKIKMSTNNEIEQEIQHKNLNAPRLTPKHIEESIKLAQFYIFPGTTTTICCLTLQNGFTVLGESACASPANFDKELGEKIAKQNAKEKIWALEGYLLKEHLMAMDYFEGDKKPCSDKCGGSCTKV